MEFRPFKGNPDLSEGLYEINLINFYWELAKKLKNDEDFINFFDYYNTGSKCPPEALFCDIDPGGEYYACVHDFLADPSINISEEEWDDCFHYLYNDIFLKKEYPNLALVNKFKIYAVKYCLQNPHELKEDTLTKEELQIFNEQNSSKDRHIIEGFVHSF